jgi:hypothetical protein
MLLVKHLIRILPSATSYYLISLQLKAGVWFVPYPPQFESPLVRTILGPFSQMLHLCLLIGKGLDIVVKLSALLFPTSEVFGSNRGSKTICPEWCFYFTRYLHAVIVP